MKLKVVPVGPYGVNCCLVWEDPAQAWVFDPGADPERIVRALSSAGLTCSAVFMTHGHFDHISAVNRLLSAVGTEIPVHLHPADVEFAFSPFNASPPDYPPTSRPNSLVTDLADGLTLESGGLSARVIVTPGHTPGGCCYWFESGDVLLSGDTLFAGSIGRTDFPGGSLVQMRVSLRRLMALPENLRVICGHGPETSIGEEKHYNSFREMWDDVP